MADQKKQGSQPDRQGQNPGTGTERTTDPNRPGQERSGQTGAPREQNREQGSERTTGTDRTTGTGSETRNRPEGDVEGLGNQGKR